jgi:hypothetical protein
MYLVAVLAVFGVMRGVGFKVKLASLWWPPAWSEVRGAQAEYFVQQAKDAYTRGEMREVMRSLGVAQSIAPANYEVGMLMARFNQIANPVFADSTYARLLTEHEARRNETAEVWFRSLLARNRLSEIAELAGAQIKSDPTRAAVWVHALVFAARQQERPEWLEVATQGDAVPAAAKAVLMLAARVQRSASAAERRTLLLTTPVRTDFPYDVVYRIEQLIEDGFTDDARAALAASRNQLPGRDIARLTLAAYARAANDAQVRQEFAGLFSPERNVRVAELELLALHLVRYPSAGLVREVIQATERVTAESAEAQAQLYFALIMAAGVQRDEEAMEQAERKLQGLLGRNLPVVTKVRDFYFVSPMSGSGSGPALANLLPEITPLSLELNYALLAQLEQLR